MNTFLLTLSFFHNLAYGTELQRYGSLERPIQLPNHRENLQRLTNPGSDPYTPEDEYWTNIPKGSEHFYISVLSQACNQTSQPEKKSDQDTNISVTPLALELDRYLESVPKIQQLNPELIVLFAGTLSTVMALADSRLNQELLSHFMINNTLKTDVVRGLIYPALELIDKSIMFGNREIADVINPLIKLVSPNLGSFLGARLNLPIHFEVNPMTNPAHFVVSIETHLRNKSTPSIESQSSDSFGSYFRGLHSGGFKKMNPKKISTLLPTKPSRGDWIDPPNAARSNFDHQSGIHPVRIFSRSNDFVSLGAEKAPFSGHELTNCKNNCSSKYYGELSRAVVDSVVAGAAAGITGGLKPGISVGAVTLTGGILKVDSSNRECLAHCEKENVSKTTNSEADHGANKESVGPTPSHDLPRRREETATQHHTEKKSAILSTETREREKQAAEVEKNRAELAAKQAQEKKNLEIASEAQRKEMERKHDLEVAAQAKERQEAEARAREAQESAREAQRRRSEEDVDRQRLVDRHNREEKEQAEKQKKEREDLERSHKEEMDQHQRKWDQSKDGKTVGPDFEDNSKKYRPSTQYLPIPLQLKLIYGPEIHTFEDSNLVPVTRPLNDMQLSFALKDFIQKFCEKKLILGDEITYFER